MNRITSQRGLSLVELLLALAITVVILAPLVDMQRTAASAGAIVRDQMEVQREADFALDRIAARIRATAPAVLPSKASDDTSGNWFGTVTFQRKGEQLIERSGGTDRVLAEQVTGFSILAPATPGAQPVIQVILSLSRNGATTKAEAMVRMGTAL